MAAISDANRAQRTWAKIQRKPSSVVFTKPRTVDGVTGAVTAATPLAAQTVRVVADNRASLMEAAAGATPTRTVMIFGVKDHPDASVLDTNIAVGYEASIDNQKYRVTQIWLVPGGVQAQARMIG